MIGTRAWKWQAKRDIHGMAKACDLDRGHPHVVIRGDYGIELAAQRTHKHGIRGKRPSESFRARHRRQQRVVLAAEASAVAGVWIHCTQRDTGLRNVEPLAQSRAREACGLCDRASGDRGGHVAQSHVRGGEHHAKPVRGKHHGRGLAGECGEHLGVPRIVEATLKQRVFVDGRGDDAVHLTSKRHGNRPLDGSAGKAARIGDAHGGRPVAHRHRGRDSKSGWTNHQCVARRGNGGVLERGAHDFRANPARIAERDRESNATLSRHATSGRHSDVLLLQEQNGVAARLGTDADSLLRQVSASGRAIAYASDVTWHWVGRSSVSKPFARLRRRSDRSTRAPLAQGVVLQDGEAVLAADAEPTTDATLLLRAAAAAAQAGVRLSPYAVERLARESPPLPTPWPREARELMVSLLGAGRAALPVWEALDQAGLTTALIPEWEVVRSAPQRNPVHQFTVDRHLVETAVNAAGLTRRVSRPDLLLVGALLHDIGKGREGDHTEVGMELVADIAPRMGFDVADTATLVTMVEHHLLLPQVATRRDHDDPATVAHVVSAVGDHHTLELLHALTEADAAATGPAAWSEWKKQLIDELVARTHAALRGEDVSDTAQLTAAQQELLRGSGIDVLIEPAGALTRVTVAAEDRVGLLATVAGVLALNRLSVRAATTQSGHERAVTVWLVAPDFGEIPASDKLSDDVRRALDGRLDVVSALAKRASSYERRRAGTPPPARVDVVANASQRSTVLEVRAHDQPGLLHLVASSISATGVTIVGARVATLGSEVVDVFYLQDGGGSPLLETTANQVRAALLATLPTTA